MAAERKMKKGETIDAFIARQPEPLREIMTALRAIVRETAPDLEEKPKWSWPTFVGRSNVAYIAPMNGYVNLGFFRGAELPDPVGIVEGTGKGLRHVKVRSLEDMPRAALEDLVRAAIRLDAAG